MSTRAIIGIQYADGNILGAWQWNDGDNLTRFLNSKFNTMEKAKALIGNGMWGSMFTQKEVLELFKKTTVSGLLSEKTLVEVCGIWLMKDKHHVNRAPTIYKSFASATGQDINHIYLFNPITSKWVRDTKII